MLCCLDQRRADQWHELQKRRQQGIGRGRELLAQLQGSTRDMLCGLRGLTKQVDLGAMDAAQLNEYAQRLGRKLNSTRGGGTNLGRCVTRALDIQMHVQQQLENRQDGSDQRSLESARDKASDIIQQGLNTMKSTQLKEYVHGLEQEVQTNGVQFVTRVSDIQMYVQERLEKNLQGKTDRRRNLESARDKASEIIQRRARCYGCPAQLNEYAQGLEHKLKPRRQGSQSRAACDKSFGCTEICARAVRK